MASSQKEFKILETKDVRTLLERKEFDLDKFKLKPVCKKSKDILMLTRKDYKRFTEQYSAQIVGNVKYRQKHYKNYSSQYELVTEKQKRHIIGQLKLNTDNDIKLYDIRKPKKRHTVGYAWVGGNKFIRMTTFNPILFLLPLLLFLIILLFINNPDKYIIAPQKPIQEEYPAVMAAEENINVDYIAFPEKVTLTSGSKNLSVKNLNSNKNVYDISYEILVDGESFGNTGAIQAGQEVPLYEGKFNLYDKLDAGTYDLCCIATEYDCITHKALPQTYMLTTILVVDK